MDNKELLEYVRFFRMKANTDKLIVFVGAGVSCNTSNMPSWNDLIKQMANSIGYSRCDICREKVEGCEQGCRLKNSYSTDEYLKIPQYVYNGDERLYYRVLYDNIQHDLTIDAPLSNAIIDLAPAHIITTNYDKLIEKCKSVQIDNYEVVISDRDLLNTTKNKYIIKMHGDIEDIDTIVLKEADYLEYTQKHVLIEMFIKSLLTDHTILFLGYSLNDYNVKLIISWINYIRTQNKALEKTTKFAYIVLDEDEISSNQLEYFESNNIGVVNLNRMPLIEKIPGVLTKEKGKRLYSFLRTIENPFFEKVFGANLLLDDVGEFVKKYKYVDIDNLCSLLHIKQYSVEGYELFLRSDSEYERLVELLGFENANSQYLQQLFFDAGVYYIRLISTSTNRRQNYVISISNLTLMNDKCFSLYLCNDYLKLSDISIAVAQTDLMRSCFYMSLVKGYAPLVYKAHDSIEYDTLSDEDTVRYLFNASMLDAMKTYVYSSRRVSKYISGFVDARKKKMFSLYFDIFDGNSKRIQELSTALNKLKDRYYNSNDLVIGAGSLSELFKIRRIALEQYLFYFSNTLLFKGSSDLKKILKYYIEAIACTNGNFVDSCKGELGFRSIKERYQMDEVDFDIITKFISVKDLISLIQDYSVDKFLVSKELTDHAITCFSNLTCYIVEQHSCDRIHEVANQWISCMLMLCHFTPDDLQRQSIKESIDKAFKSEAFTKFFFSINFPHFRQSTRVLNELLKSIPKSLDLDAIDVILHSDGFKDFYVNSDVRKLQSIFSYFVDVENIESMDEKLHAIIMSFEEKERVMAIRLLYKCLSSSQYICEYKDFIKNNYNLISNDDIIDFAFDDWLEITDVHRKEMLSRAVDLYKQQKTSSVYSYPDPLQSQLELIYILYITEKITDIEGLREIMADNYFLQFFLEPDNFDYSKVDFSDYMWENIVRQERYRNMILSHKSEIISRLRQRIETDQATEVERKILYRYMMDEDELL